MFTGIIEGLGTLVSASPAGGGRRLRVDAGFDLEGTKIGDSIAINGACLTVVALSGRRFSADVSPETLARTVLGDATSGARVNVERAMRLSDRLDGHLVSGHVDGTGTIQNRIPVDNAVIVTISAPENMMVDMIEKGSVAVDGISLTINARDADGFSVSIIPHTASMTTIGRCRPGDRVNIETDMIGKYVKRFLTSAKVNKKNTTPANREIDMNFLARKGFL